MSASSQLYSVILSPNLDLADTAILQSVIKRIENSKPLHLTLTHDHYQVLKDQLELRSLPSAKERELHQVYFSLSSQQQLVNTAIKITALHQSEYLEYWSNDLGFFSANPSLIPNAKLIQYLDYQEAKEMMLALNGDLRAEDIEELQQKAIPFHYISLQMPELKGTIISNRSETDAPQVKMLTLKQDVTTVTLRSSKMARRSGFLAQVFSCFAALDLSIDHLATSEDQITLTIDTSCKEQLENKLDELHHLLKGHAKVEINSARCTLSLVGNKVKSSWHKIAPIFSLFEEHPIYLMSYAAADINMSLVLEYNQALRLLKALHTELIEGDIVNPIFGSSWAQLQQREENNVISEAQQPWWYHRQDELLEIANQSAGPLYVYNLPTVKERALQLKKLSSIDHILFAIKANNNPDILKVVEAAGHGFECVSAQEVAHVLNLFPAINRKRVLFTPNFSPKEEYQKALEWGVNLTLDSTFPLENWPDIFRGKEVFVRIDTGIGKGHHHYVHTAGNQSKFGVPPQEIQKLIALCQQYSVKVVGLHAHAGSGILTPDAWNKVGQYLFGLLPQFPFVKVVDLGGGLGVPERLGQDSLALEQVQQTLAEFKAQAPDIKLWMEPGRFFVAESGVILAHVTQVKKKGDIQYIGIDTGMNSLIRPALYGAHHEIKNLTRLRDQDNFRANVVGPICESGDVLGHARPLPRATQSKDIILIGTAGAYGRVMSSHYTMREPAVEVTLTETRARK